jgi:hypothetical protein
VKRLGLSHAAIAARMHALREAGAAGLGNAVAVPPHFMVAVDGVRGVLPCPYEDGIVAKTNITVVNERLGRTLLFTDLNIHLIETHGFYLGHGALYRMDPAELAEILEVPPTGER